MPKAKRKEKTCRKDSCYGHPMPDNRPRTSPVTSEQALLSDASVYSAQWVDLPPGSPPVTPDELLASYLRHVHRWTRRLVIPVRSADGISFRLAGTGRDLIAFLPPLREEGGITLAIRGGILVQRDQCDRGKLTFGVSRREEMLRITLELSDYCPLILGSSRPSRIRKLLYRFTQALIHRLVTVHFLERVYRELTGTPPPPSRIAGSTRGEPL